MKSPYSQPFLYLQQQDASGGLQLCHSRALKMTVPVAERGRKNSLLFSNCYMETGSRYGNFPPGFVTRNDICQGYPFHLVFKFAIEIITELALSPWANEIARRKMDE